MASDRGEVIDLERVKRSIEQTGDGVLYVSVGAFDVRFELGAGRLAVKVFPLCGEGNALAECEASSEEVCRGCPAECGRGDPGARLAALEMSAAAGRGSAAQEVNHG